MSLLSRLFGKTPVKTPVKTPDPILHKSCRIFPQPVKDGATYRIAARIEKEFGDTVKTHLLQRADTCTSLEEATAISTAKAMQAIDQLGDTLFA